MLFIFEFLKNFSAVISDMAECRAPGERREALSEKLSVLHRRAVGAQSGAVRKQEPDRSGNGQGGRNRIWSYQMNCI